MEQTDNERLTNEYKCVIEKYTIWVYLICSVFYSDISQDSEVQNINIAAQENFHLIPGI